MIIGLVHFGRVKDVGSLKELNTSMSDARGAERKGKPSLASSLCPGVALLDGTSVPEPLARRRSSACGVAVPGVALVARLQSETVSDRV